MPSLELFCTIEAEMGRKIIGDTPAGMRIDFPFEGTATGPHWEGERPVSGIDYVTLRSDGNMDLIFTPPSARSGKRWPTRGVGFPSSIRTNPPSRGSSTFQTGN